MNRASGVDPNQVVRVRHAAPKPLDRQHSARLPAGAPSPLDRPGRRRPPKEIARLVGLRGWAGHWSSMGPRAPLVNRHA